MAPDAASILAVAVTEHGHAVRALADHLLAAGWNEDCADCLSLQGHVERTEHQVRLLTAAEPEEVTLW